MSKNLVIVESPAKGKTIEKYLGKDFTVLASYGHVRDLIPKEGAVATGENFEMSYEVIARNEKHVRKITAALKKSDALYLATDPDREGEAIAWHLCELLKEKGLLKDKPVHRIVFHEITKNAVREALEHPREVSQTLVNAQQARRALDYLVGFNLSPLLWRKVSPGLSAGRVQSPALRLICEREDEIEKFISQEYWSIEAELGEEKLNFRARLYEYAGKKVEQFSFTNETDARNASDSVKAFADSQGGTLPITAIEKKQRRRNPSPPFITSTLQQDASRKLGFTTSRTMRLAQNLYEGISIDGESIGLITYMRTDSVSLAKDAVDEIRQVVTKRFGSDHLPDAPRAFKSKSKNAQEAHEAIRPSSVARDPESVRRYLEDDQFKLYQLIWRRAMACQMAPAVYNTVALSFAGGENTTLRATGSTLIEPGFLAVYQNAEDDSDDDSRLPAVEEGQSIPLRDMLPEQHFTEPPPRFTEASLVKSLEEFDIGRPSTYASIISTLLKREYVDLEQRRFTPTHVGRVVNAFLTKHFMRYVDYKFTAELEDELDAVSRGEKDWVPLLSEFWIPFQEQVETKKDIPKEEVAMARQLGTDPKSGRPVSVRIGRFGPFVQIGTKDDEDKPKWAGLRPEQKMDKITLDDALFLFNLPRDLGETPEGEEVQANIGRFGPYVRYGKKFASLKEDDPYTITLERALEVVAAKKAEDAARLILDFPEAEIQVLNGRYGPYITDKKKNAKVPKDREPASLTLEECIELIAAAPDRGKRGRKTAKKAPAKKAAKKTAKKAAKKKPAKKKPAKKSAKKAAKKAVKKTAKKTTTKPAA